MFNLGQVLWNSCKDSSPKTLTIGLVGLDNAGKSTVLASMMKEPLEQVLQTVGFKQESFSIGRKSIECYDLGGGERIRGIWKRYYAEMFGIVFVIDISAPEVFQEVKQVLETTIQETFVQGKPLLILLNKSDSDDAVSLDRAKSMLTLDNILSKHQDTHIRIEYCSACTLGSRRKPNKPIRDGLKWLIEAIVTDIDQLLPRVETETKEQRQIEKREREEKRERIRKRKEQEAKAKEGLNENLERASVAWMDTSVNGSEMIDNEDENSQQATESTTDQVEQSTATPKGPSARQRFRAKITPLSVSTQDSATPSIPSDQQVLLNTNINLQQLASRVATCIRQVYPNYQVFSAMTPFCNRAILSATKQSWSRIVSQARAKKSFSLDRVCQRGVMGWAVIVKHVWDREGYGDQHTATVRAGNRGFRQEQFSNDDGYALYLSRCTIADVSFSRQTKTNKAVFKLIAEIVLDQLICLNPHLTSMSVRNRDAEIYSKLIEIEAIHGQLHSLNRDRGDLEGSTA